MKNDTQTDRRLLREATLTAVILVGLAAIKGAATTIHTMPHGRFPAMMIQVMGSRIIEDNPGVAGYYERLLHGFEVGCQARLDAGRPVWGNDTLISGRNFRLYRLRPNFRNLNKWVMPEPPTNSFGFAGREWSQHKPPNTRRVALLGDSVSEGWGVDPSESFGSLLENQLNTSHPHGLPQRFEVLNFSVPGYRLTQLRDVAAEDAVRFEPDVYMVALTELAVFRSWDTHLINLVELKIDPKYKFLRETLSSAKASERDDPSELRAKLAYSRIPVIREMLLEMKSTAEQHHAEFIVLLVPTLEDADLTRRRFEGIPEMLVSTHITVIDLLATFDGIPNLMPLRYAGRDVHPNARGHLMIFNNLYAKLRADPVAWAALVGTGTENPKQAEASTPDKHD